VRPPDPEALLLDHPAIPVPVPHAGGLSFRPPVPLAPSRGDRVRRQVIAAQLLAATSLLAEHDLWPGSGALRRGGLAGAAGPCSAMVGGFPRRLSDLHRRLGGGERAIRLVLDRAVAVVSAAAGLPASLFRGIRPGHALTLAPWLDRLLDGLPRPLDPETARSLWCVRWRLPDDPAPGEVAYWSVEHRETALRLAAAFWARLRRRGRSVALNRAPLEDTSTVSLPLAGGGTLILVGELGSSDLGAAERWAHQQGCNAIAVGKFPAGWDPPQPPFGEGPLAGRLSLTGAPADTLRLAVEGRSGRFAPLVLADRRALTQAAGWRFDPSALAAARGGSEEPGGVERLLALLPSGLPEGFLVLHGGVSAASLRRGVEAAGGVSEAGVCRLADPRPLGRDPLHREVAELFSEGDPQRLLHLCLAGGNSAALVAWCRRRNAELDGAAVRSLLGEVDPQALDQALLQELIEACLSDRDLSGARRALAALDPEAGRPWRQWLDSVDRPPGWKPEVPPSEDRERAPRAAAEVGLWALRAAVLRGGAGAEEAGGAVSSCLARVEGAARWCCELSRAQIERPELLADPRWRREATSGNPTLRRRLAHCRALALAKGGRPRHAARLLEVAIGGEDSPGWKGLLEVDAGLVALLEGRDGEADLHNLRAFRLLQAAGFAHQTLTVVFNMAVADLDRLELRRAQERFEKAGDPASDPKLQAERARLALARGKEEEFVGRVASLPALEGLRDRETAEGIGFLLGVADLLRGDLASAREKLARGGQEAGAWLALVDALGGYETEAPDDDGWGVGRAALLLTASSQRGSEKARELLPRLEELAPRDALALALLERVAGRQGWVPGAVRSRCLELLKDRGMDGWWRHMLAGGGWAEGYMWALVKLVDGGGLAALGPAEERQLLEVLGLAGLEVRSAPHDGVLWCAGSGEPGEALPAGRLTVVPLGGALPEGPAWELLRALLELLCPPSAGEQDPDVEATGMHGVSDAIAGVRTELQKLAPSRVPVLLLGETGVGKEVAAQALHRLSGRPGRFVAVNVAAIPATLLEAELFGVVRGAYTGADRPRRGLVEAADGGTLFLDEIGDLELALQAKLLRFLDSFEVRPVGSDVSRTVDVRVVTATNLDLDQLRKKGLFRSDLYFRMALAPVTIPPLRERREDIPVLRDLFAELAAARHGLAPARWGRAAEQALLAHAWPGNVRELRHVVEVAMIRAGGGAVDASSLPAAGAAEPPAGTWVEALARFRRQLLESTLDRHGGNRSAAARALGITRQTLLYHLKALGIERR